MTESPITAMRNELVSAFAALAPSNGNTKEKKTAFTVRAFIVVSCLSERVTWAKVGGPSLRGFPECAEMLRD